eukprot:2171259-Rhodomonas_salina.1
MPEHETQCQHDQRVRCMSAQHGPTKVGTGPAASIRSPASSQARVSSEHRSVGIEGGIEGKIDAHVAARFEALDDALDARSCRDHDDREGGAVVHFADALADLDARHFWHHYIEHHKVRQTRAALATTNLTSDPGIETARPLGSEHP